MPKVSLSAPGRDSGWIHAKGSIGLWSSVRFLDGTYAPLLMDDGLGGDGPEYP